MFADDTDLFLSPKIINILYAIIVRRTWKCLNVFMPPVFCNDFTHRAKTKYAFRNEHSIQEPLFRTNFSQYYMSYRGPYLLNKIVISKTLAFSDSNSLEAFKCELKRLLLSVELNHLGISAKILPVSCLCSSILLSM